MRTYRVIRTPKAVVCFVDDDGKGVRHLVHRPRSLPTDPAEFEFGYGGAGPANLARSIMWDHLGREPHPACYQDFKWTYIAPAPPEGFSIISEQIDRWLVTWRAKRTMEGEHYHATVAEFEASLVATGGCP
jgi:hypothetical protein